MTDKQYELNYEILESLDKIDKCVMESQFDVLMSLCDVYDKSYVLSEYCDTFTQESCIFQEFDKLKMKEILNPKNLIRRFIELLKAIGNLITKIVSKLGRNKEKKQIISNIMINQSDDGFPLEIKIVGSSTKREEEVLNYVRNNITKKGNLDHTSSNQKVLAIIDRVTNKRLNSVNAIGVYAPAINNTSLKITNFKSFKSYYNSKGTDFINKYVHKITVGEVDKHKSFKATHWFNNDTVYDPDFECIVDNSMDRRTAAEGFITKRGVKLNDLKETYVPGSINYKNPSKKDGKRSERFNKVNDELHNIDMKYGTGSDGINKKREVLDKYKHGKPFTESFYDDEVFQEASHGKLKYDFRHVYDFETGHALKIIYSLDGINIDKLGNGWKSNDAEYIAKIEKAIMITFKDNNRFSELIDIILTLQNEYDIKEIDIDYLKKIKSQIAATVPFDIKSFQNCMDTLSKSISTLCSSLTKILNDGGSKFDNSKIKTDISKMTESLKYINDVITKLNKKTGDIK